MTKAHSANILIRADASPVIGSGHVMRCLTLAQALKHSGVNVSFAMRAFNQNKIRYIQNAGFNVISLKPTICPEPELYTSWLGGTVSNDVSSSLGNSKWDLVILDHYGAGPEWQRAILSQKIPLLVIDDGIHNKIFCDLLLNTNLGFDEDYYKSSTTNKTLLGPAFALIKDSIYNYRNSKQIRSHLNHILISLGGYDAEGYSYDIAKHIPIGYKITILAGENNPRYEELRALKEFQDIDIIEFTSNIGKIIADADFCFGAGGSSTWERCCLGLPSALFYLADNQMEIVKNLAAAKTCLDLGHIKDFNFQSIPSILETLCSNNSTLLNDLSLRARTLVDGQGTMRVVQEILNYINKRI